MTALIRKFVFAGANKNMTAPQIFIILCIYAVVVSVYTWISFGTQAMIMRFGISVFIVVSYVVVERSPLNRTITAVVSPLIMYGALTFGAIYFKSDFLIFTYTCCIAMISLTYLKPKALSAYIMSSSAVSAVLLFLFKINLLGPAFSDVYNMLYFFVSIALNYLVYTFCKFYVQSLEALTEAKNEANAANQAKSAFLGTMSHEIRTPLNAILGITEILLQKEMLDPQEKEALYKVYTSGDLLLGIINDILDLSKIEAGKLELIVAQYEIASLISDTAQLNIMRIGNKPITFEICVDENLPTRLSGDELRVKQILNNLLSNAFKYTSAGTVKLSVSADMAENDGEAVLLISVADTGQGMSKEQVDKLFDEYTRFNMVANRTTEGTGLGMSITRNLIKMMNGTISVESEPGKGSEFTVCLPQGKAGLEVLGREVAENLQQFHTNIMLHLERLQVERDFMPYGSVLIVDDIETNIYVAKGFLAPYGLKIDSADSGFAAIDKIRDGNTYDIIFMDHMMPVMDGIEAAKKIRDMGYENAIVALTANAVAGQADIFLHNGFNDFISKPIEIPQLNNVLNKLIRDKQPPEVIAAARRTVKNEHVCKNMQQASVDPKLTEVFIRDAVKSIAVIEPLDEMRGLYDDSTIRTYIIHMHGMKSALANIGETELSAAALKLETAGREGNIDVMSAETPVFLDSLRAVIEKLTLKEENESIEATDEEQVYLHEKLGAIKAACDEYDIDTADRLLAELREKAWPHPIKEFLGDVAEFLLHSEFDEIADAVNMFCGRA